jgi:two-component system, OmpR family, sensor histidine kinase KdpD
MMAVTNGRGHHKIFLGMAAGVGKTYRMLQEGQAEAEAGIDVIIGYLEPHDRPATAAQAIGLPVIPRRGYSYRGNRIEDMDVEAIIARRPELCLIDELAHTNAPGGINTKRYEDVENVLAAGVNVYSTVNVQHLESLNDQVTELTGVRVRETVPDAVLAAADEVVLVDITPQSLIERLQAGKIYKPEAIQSALAGFFKIENLSSLREVALRQVAEEVEAKRLPPSSTPVLGSGSRARDRLVNTQAQHAIGERLLALVTPEPQAQRVVRRAWRSAQRLGAELDVLWVARGKPSDEQSEQLDALRRLTSVLGAHMLIEYGDGVAVVAQRVARERGTTYVLIGRPHRRSPIARVFSPSLPSQLLAALPGVDLRIVADRTEVAEARRTGPRDERLLLEAATATSGGGVDSKIVAIEPPHRDERRES